MWTWLSGVTRGRAHSHRRDFSLAGLQQLHVQLLSYKTLPDAELVELLRMLSELLVYSDQNRIEPPPASDFESIAGASTGSNSSNGNPPSAGVFFDYFCEKNILGLLVQLGESAPSSAVQIQLLQTLSILVQNIATQTSLYYILSNDYLNKLLECPFAVHSDDDVRDWYVTLLKALSLRLNEDTVQFFFNASHNSFPLYAQALKFGRCPETMIQVAVKTLTLNVFKVQDDRLRRFILEYNDMAYFSEIVEFANEIALKIQGLLNQWTRTTARSAHATMTMLTEKLEEAIDEYIDHMFYLQDILDVNLPELCYKIGDMLYTTHVKKFLAASILPDCNPPPQRVSTRLALYLLTRLMGIFEHAPLVNALSFMLLSPDASESCLYSAVALGAGSSRRNSGAFREQKRLAKRLSNTSKAITSASAAAMQHTFRAHSSEICDSPLCYLQTRYSQGEWPVAEVTQFVPHESNCFRQSLLALMTSSDEMLSSAAILLLLAIMNNEAVDHTLLRELELLPYRRRRHKRSRADRPDVQGASLPLSRVNSVEVEDDDVGTEETSGLSSGSSSSSDLSASLENELDEGSASGSSSREELDTASCKYANWLVDIVLSVLVHSTEHRLVSTQLCARLLLDILVDSNEPGNAHCMREDHAAKLKEIHSVSTYHVMQSMRGAMADIDLFIYVLEDEFEDFERTKFPVSLGLKTSSPYEYLVSLHAGSSGLWDLSDHRMALRVRSPVNEMEVCRKSMRVFLTLRRLRELISADYNDDQLLQFVTFRHPHTALLDAARAKSTAVALDGMVSLRCIWREQRFLPSPPKLCMVLNAEALVVVEPTRWESDQPANEGVVRLFAPIHRTYCTIDAKDDRVLHFTVSSAIPIENCRLYNRVDVKENLHGGLKSWHVSVLFESSEDCKQTKAHVDVCRAEVRAYKLMQIEESLTTHVQITHSHVTSPRTNARRLSMEIEELRREQEHEGTPQWQEK